MPEQSVAPLTGSVDRNTAATFVGVAGCESLPSRGAWIEMMVVAASAAVVPVAPLTGSVDRNITLTYDEEHLPGRSPHGERG